MDSNTVLNVIRDLKVAINSNKPGSVIIGLEEQISKNINIAITQDSFFELPMTTLQSIIQNSDLLNEEHNHKDTIDSVKQILKKASILNPTEAPLLLNILDIPFIDQSECLDILSSLKSSPLCSKLTNYGDQENQEKKDGESKPENIDLQNELEKKDKEIQVLRGLTHQLREKMLKQIHPKRTIAKKPTRNYDPNILTASRDGNIASVEYIISSAISEVVDKKYVQENTTPLHIAANSGHLNIVSLLVREGATINMRDSFGYTPLHFAAKRGYLDIVKFLVENGADVNAKEDKYKYSPFRVAAEEGHLAVMKYLFEKGVDISQLDSYGWTALHQTASKGYTDCVQWLVDNHVDPMIKSVKGCTALHRAANVKIAQLLLDHGANINEKDMYGITPLFWASNNNRPEVVRFLLAHGAIADVTSTVGESPLNLAPTPEIRNMISKAIKEQKNQKK